MALEIWFPPDVDRILATAADALVSITEVADPPPSYVTGFSAALRLVATAFGRPFPTAPYRRVVVLDLDADTPAGDRRWQLPVSAAGYTIVGDDRRQGC